MKTLKYIPAAALLALAGCQNEEIQPLDFLTDPNAVRISASVGRMDTRSNPHDDALPSFNKGDQISVSTADQPAVVYTFDGTNTWTPEEGKYLTWLSESSGSMGQIFGAYYPSTYTGGGNLPIETDQSNLGNLQKSDIMSFYGSRTKGKNNTVSLTLQRKTARIVIKKDFEWKGQYMNSTTSTSTHSVTSLHLEGTKGNTTTTIIPYVAPSGDRYVLLDPTFTNVSITIGVAPNEGGGDGETLIISSIPTLEAGKSYTYTLTLGKDKATVGNVTVAKWATGSILGEGSEGKAEELTYRESVEGGVTTYTVYNATGLQEVNWLVRNNLSANITLAGDIALSTPSDGGSNWTPIGSNQEAYTGTFDGAGHTIRGLVINRSSNYQGLIGYLGKGTVKNVTIEGCTITGESSIGGIAGGNEGGIIENCIVKATSGKPVSITGMSSDIGGIVGGNYQSGTVIGCRVLADGGAVTVASSNSFTMVHSNYVGGIVGLNGSILAACFVKGVDVKGSEESVGGIAGGNIKGENSADMSDCYAYQCMGVSGNQNVVGKNVESNVTNCFYVALDGAEVVGYNSSTDTTWEQALEAMNSAITSTGWQWSGTQDNPTLTKVTSDDAQE